MSTTHGGGEASKVETGGVEADGADRGEILDETNKLVGTGAVTGWRARCVHYDVWTGVPHCAADYARSCATSCAQRGATVLAIVPQCSTREGLVGAICGAAYAMAFMLMFSLDCIGPKEGWEIILCDLLGFAFVLSLRQDYVEGGGPLVAVVYCYWALRVCSVFLPQEAIACNNIFALWILTSIVVMTILRFAPRAQARQDNMMLLY